MDAKEAGKIIGSLEFVAETVDKILPLLKAKDYASVERYLQGLKKITLAQVPEIRRMISLGVAGLEKSLPQGMEASF